MEEYALPLFLGGLSVAAAAWTWLIMCAFRQRPAWGPASTRTTEAAGVADALF
jgi:hypothetical protein